jgi:hypothetical protein
MHFKLTTAIRAPVTLIVLGLRYRAERVGQELVDECRFKHTLYVQLQASIYAYGRCIRQICSSSNTWWCMEQKMSSLPLKLVAVTYQQRLRQAIGKVFVFFSPFECESDTPNSIVVVENMKSWPNHTCCRIL